MNILRLIIRGHITGANPMYKDYWSGKWPIRISTFEQFKEIQNTSVPLIPQPKSEVDNFPLSDTHFISFICTSTSMNVLSKRITINITEESTRTGSNDRPNQVYANYRKEDKELLLMNGWTELLPD